MSTPSPRPPRPDSNGNGRSSNRWFSWLITLLPVAALSIAIIALYFTMLTARSNRQEVVFKIQTQSLSEGERAELAQILEQVEETHTRANDSIEFANLILSFIEGASILAGLVLLGAGVFGIANIQDLRRDNQAIQESVVQRLSETESRLAKADAEYQRRKDELENLGREIEKTLALAANLQAVQEDMNQVDKELKKLQEAISKQAMAQRMAREQNIEAAIYMCREVYELNPDNDANNYLLGLLLMRRGLLDEAIKHLKEAYESTKADNKSASAPAQGALGLAMRKKGDSLEDPLERNWYYSQAESHMLEAVEQDPYLLTDDHQSYFGALGSLYRRQGRTEEAIHMYEQSIHYIPRRSYPHINLAMLYIEKSEEEISQDHCSKAEILAIGRLKDTSEDYWAKYDLALSYLLQNNLDAARQTFIEANSIARDHNPLQSVLARLLYLKRIKPEVEGLDEIISLMQISIKHKREENITKPSFSGRQRSAKGRLESV